MSSSAVLVASLLYLPNYVVLLVAVTAVRPGQPDLPAGLGHPAVGADSGEPAGDDLRDVPVRAEPRHHRRAAARLRAVQPRPPGLHPAVLGRGAGRAGLRRAGPGGAAQAGAAGQPRPAPRPRSPAGSYLDVLRDRRYMLFLVAALFNAAVYVQYLSTLPLDVKAEGRGDLLVHRRGGAERPDRDRLRTAADQDLPALAVQAAGRPGVRAGRASGWSATGCRWARR